MIPSQLPPAGSSTLQSQSVAPRAAGIASSSVHREGLVAYAGASQLPKPIAASSTAPGTMKRADSVHFTEDTENFIVGDRIWVNGVKAGKIQFIGETKFAPGDWAGVVLDENEGKNDGSVNGTRYFQCQANRGVFVRLHKLSRVSLSKEEIEAAKMHKMSTATSTSSITQAVDKENQQHRIPHVSGYEGTPEIGGLKIGLRVWLSGDRSGVIRYIGKPHFQEGIWAGVELDDAKGKNDGSVDGQRYFTCSHNHGVFAPLAKISKAALPTSSGIQTPGRLKRSPSQESLHSNYSIQSTASRRSTAIRLGTSSLSPSTVTVARTGTGTPAEIQRAHHEKDALIATLTRERDLARKELDAKSNQERDVHLEIQKLQEQYVGALTVQEARITELSESLAQITQEKENLQGLLDDEKRKGDDLQFRLEEELMAGETRADGDSLEKVLAEKNSETVGLKKDIDVLRSQIKELQCVISEKTAEIVNWKGAAEGSKQKTAEIADDRDKIAFEVADLSRRLRDVTEKHQIEVAKLQGEIEERLITEQDLKKTLLTVQDQLSKLQENKSEVNAAAQEQIGNLESRLKQLQEESALHQKQLLEAHENQSNYEEDNEALRSSSHQAQTELNARKLAIATLFDSLGEKTPDDPDAQLPTLSRLLHSLQLNAMKESEERHAQVAAAQHSIAEARQAVLALEEELDATKQQLIGKARAIDGAENDLTTLRSQINEIIRRNSELEEKLQGASLNKEASFREMEGDLNRVLADKKMEVETLLYQLSENGIELYELKNTHRQLLERSQTDLSNATSAHQLELQQLMQKQALQLEDLKTDFETEKAELQSRLTVISGELEAVLTEKVLLNNEIGKFIQVLQDKDVELKEARKHIEDSFAREYQEKTVLSGQVDQHKTVVQLEQEMTSLSSALATRNTEFAKMFGDGDVKDRELVQLRESCATLETIRSNLQDELENCKAAFAQQMVLTELNKEEQLQKFVKDRVALNEKISDLEHKVQELSGRSASDVQVLRETYSTKLCSANLEIENKSAALQWAENLLGELRTQLQVAEDRSITACDSLKKTESDLAEVKAQNMELKQQGIIALEEQRNAVKLLEGLCTENNELKRLPEIIKQKDLELSESMQRCQQSEQFLAEMHAEAETSAASFAQQMLLAQFRLEDLHKTVDSERAALNCQIEDLQSQLIASSASKTSLIQTATTDLHEKMRGMESELAEKSATLLSTVEELHVLQNELAFSKADAATLSSAEQSVQLLTQEAAEKNRLINSLETRLSEMQRIPEDLSSQLNVTSSALQESRQELLAWETKYASSQQTALNETKRNDEERGMMEKEKQELQLTIQELEAKTIKLTIVRAEHDALVRQRSALDEQVEKLTTQLVGRQEEIGRLQSELETLRGITNAPLVKTIQPFVPELPASKPDEGRELDLMLSRELDRVKSQVEIQRKTLEQKEREISSVRQSAQQLIQLKDSEISLMKDKALENDALLHKEKLQKFAAVSASVAASAGDKDDFQMQVLNSIIADQQNKIMDLEKKLLDASQKTATSAEMLKETTTENATNGKRRLIRLYCATCMQFDLHDSLDCPKRNSSSPERRAAERKAKVPRPRRKYCTECERFDDHETEECPVLQKKHPPRVPLKPTGLSQL